MKLKNILYPALVFCLALGVLMAPALADSGYTTLFTGYVSSGDVKTYNGCIVTFDIVNGSYVHVNVQSADYSSDSGNVQAGQSYYYINLLRVYVASVSNQSAYVEIAQPSSSSTSTSTGTKLWCDTPGENALGGDTVSFPITIQNNNDGDKTYTLSATSDSGWGLSFQYNGKDTYQIYVPESQQKTVNLLVDTAYNSPIGEKTIHVSTGDASMDVKVDITSINQSADVGVQVSSQIASIGDKVYYDFSIENLQSQQNNYKLSVEGLPDNWYFQYLDSKTSTSQMAEVVVPSDSTKNFVLQILPPVSVQAGDYNFTAVVTTPDNVTIRQNLTLKLTSSVSMTVTQDKLAYDSQPGQTFTIKTYVSNTGSGGALTNVYPDITAPSGWVVSSSPAQVNSIKAGETQTFVITVQSPGNIVASDYDVKVDMKSDQAESSSDYRITITTSSYIPYIGGGIILVVIVGLVFLYRKYGRR